MSSLSPNECNHNDLSIKIKLTFIGSCLGNHTKQENENTLEGDENYIYGSLGLNFKDNLIPMHLVSCVTVIENNNL